jgi:hypothetical protein
MGEASNGATGCILGFCHYSLSFVVMYYSILADFLCIWTPFSLDPSSQIWWQRLGLFTAAPTCLIHLNKAEARIGYSLCDCNQLRCEF